MPEIQYHYTNLNQSLNLTLKLMNKAEQIACNDFDFVNWVNRIFNTVSKSQEQIAYEVWSYVHNNFKFKIDDFDETIINPRLMPSLRYGDCDDFALFVKTVLRILGIKSYYILFGKQVNSWTHIAVIINKNLLIDPTNNKFNTFPDKYTCAKII